MYSRIPLHPAQVAQGPRQLELATTLLKGGYAATAQGAQRQSQERVIDALGSRGVYVVLVPDPTATPGHAVSGHWYVPAYATDATLQWAMDQGCPVAPVEDAWRDTITRWVRPLVDHAPALNHALRRVMRRGER
jgi:hypothetical protein